MVLFAVAEEGEIRELAIFEVTTHSQCLLGRGSELMREWFTFVPQRGSRPSHGW
jgi:hypothetical protein